MESMARAGKKRGSFFALMAGVFMFTILSGCVAGGNYGSLAWDRELDSLFRDYQVLPGHLYYITGGYSAPAAILAVHQSYHLANEARLWVAVPDVTPARMQRWIDNLSSENDIWGGREFFAAYVLDPDGRRIGAWYSAQRTTPVQFLDDGRVRIYTPDLLPETDGDSRELIDRLP